MKRFIIIAAASLISTTAGFAQDLTQSLVSQYQTLGYSHIEVKRGPSQIKIEGVLDGVEREIVVDIATGAIIKDESQRAGIVLGSADDVKVKDESRDFVDRSKMEDDHGDDHSDDGYDDSSDDSNDDSSDDSSDDDHGDDRSDHASSDDHGSSASDDRDDDKSGRDSHDDDDDDSDDDSDDDHGDDSDDD